MGAFTVNLELSKTDQNRLRVRRHHTTLVEMLKIKLLMKHHQRKTADIKAKDDVSLLQ